MLADNLHEKLGTKAGYEGLTIIDGGGLPWKIHTSYYVGASAFDLTEELLVTVLASRPDTFTVYSTSMTTERLEDNISWGDSMDLAMLEDIRNERNWSAQ